MTKIIIPYSPINRKRTLIPDFSHMKALSSYRVINSFSPGMIFSEASLFVSIIFSTVV